MKDLEFNESQRKVDAKAKADLGKVLREVTKPKAEREIEFKQGNFIMGRCTVIVSIDNGKWHLSISTAYASPSYKEIKAARYVFIPDNVTMAQIFPPKGEFVNVHKYCHHLWQIDNIKNL